MKTKLTEKEILKIKQFKENIIKNKIPVKK